MPTDQQQLAAAAVGDHVQVPPPLVTAADIDRATERIAGVVTRTPLELSVRHSQATGAQVYFKREDLQVVRSYNLRGA